MRRTSGASASKKPKTQGSVQAQRAMTHQKRDAIKTTIEIWSQLRMAGMAAVIVSGPRPPGGGEGSNRRPPLSLDSGSARPDHGSWSLVIHGSPSDTGTVDS